MPEPQHLNLKIGVDQEELTGLEKSFDRIKEQLKKLGSAAGNILAFRTLGLTKLLAIRTALEKIPAAVQTATNSFKEFGRNAANLVRFFTSLTGQISLLGAAIGVGFTSGRFISVGAQFEKLEAQFEFLLGSAEAAEKRIQTIIDFTKTTPFSVTNLAEAARLLQQFGFFSEDLLKTLSETAVATQKDVLDATNAFTNAISRRFIELKQFGILANREADRVRFSFRDLLGRPQVVQTLNTAAAIAEGVEQILVDRFGGSLNRFSQQWEAVLSNMFDAFLVFQRQVAEEEGVLDIAKDLTLIVTRLVNQATGESFTDQLTGAVSDRLEGTSEVFSRFQEVIGQIARGPFEAIIGALDIILPLAEKALGVIGNVLAQITEQGAVEVITKGTLAYTLFGKEGVAAYALLLDSSQRFEGSIFSLAGALGVVDKLLIGLSALFPVIGGSALAAFRAATSSVQTLADTVVSDGERIHQTIAEIRAERDALLDSRTTTRILGIDVAVPGLDLFSNESEVQQFRLQVGEIARDLETLSLQRAKALEESGRAASFEVDIAHRAARQRLQTTNNILQYWVANEEQGQAALKEWIQLNDELFTVADPARLDAILERLGELRATFREVSEETPTGIIPSTIAANASEVRRLIEGQESRVDFRAALEPPEQVEIDETATEIARKTELALEKSRAQVQIASLLGFEQAVAQATEAARQQVAVLEKELQTLEQERSQAIEDRERAFNERTQIESERIEKAAAERSDAAELKRLRDQADARTKIVNDQTANEIRINNEIAANEERVANARLVRDQRILKIERDARLKFLSQQEALQNEILSAEESVAGQLEARLARASAQLRQTTEQIRETFTRPGDEGRAAQLVNLARERARTEEQVALREAAREELDIRRELTADLLEEEERGVFQRIATVEKEFEDRARLFPELREQAREAADFQIAEIRREADDIIALVDDIGEQFQKTFTEDIPNAMADAIVDADNFGDALKGILDNLRKQILSSAISELFSFAGEELFGQNATLSKVLGLPTPASTKGVPEVEREEQAEILKAQTDAADTQAKAAVLQGEAARTVKGETTLRARILTQEVRNRLKLEVALERFSDEFREFADCVCGDKDVAQIAREAERETRVIVEAPELPEPAPIPEIPQPQATKTDETILDEVEDIRRGVERGASTLDILIDLVRHNQAESAEAMSRTTEAVSTVGGALGRVIEKIDERNRQAESAAAGEEDRDRGLIGAVIDGMKGVRDAVFTTANTTSQVLPAEDSVGVLSKVAEIARAVLGGGTRAAKDPATDTSVVDGATRISQAVGTSSGNMISVMRDVGASQVAATGNVIRWLEKISDCSCAGADVLERDVPEDLGRVVASVIGPVLDTASREREEREPPPVVQQPQPQTTADRDEPQVVQVDPNFPADLGRILNEERRRDRSGQADTTAQVVEVSRRIFGVLQDLAVGRFPDAPEPPLPVIVEAPAPPEVSVTVDQDDSLLERILREVGGFPDTGPVPIPSQVPFPESETEPPEATGVDPGVFSGLFDSLFSVIFDEAAATRESTSRDADRVGDQITAGFDRLVEVSKLNQNPTVSVPSNNASRILGILGGIAGSAAGSLGQAANTAAITDLTSTLKGVQGLASGGIVRRPTLAVVGEAGPEAVVPLSGGGFGGSVNNVGININLSGAFNGQQADPRDRPAAEQFATAEDYERANTLGQRLNEAVLRTLEQEQRPGGLLEGTRKF
jgi:hypothetical protein